MKERTTKEIIRDNLLAYQGEEGLSVQELADKIGISRNTLGFWLRADRAPSAENLADIRKATGKSIDFLLGLAPSPATDPKIRDICEYTGLSEQSVKALHELKYGKSIVETDNIIRVEPNQKALDGINALLEFAPFSNDPEKENSEADWYFEIPKVWSLFEGIYYQLFPQECPYSSDVEYNQYLIEKQMQGIIAEIRNIKNPEYGSDGLPWILREMESRLNEAEKQSQARSVNPILGGIS